LKKEYYLLNSKKENDSSLILAQDKTAREQTDLFLNKMPITNKQAWHD